MRHFIIQIIFIHLTFVIAAQNSCIIPGASRTDQYFPLLKEKNIAIVANQTSMIGSTHLLDSLVTSGFRNIKIFSPEHGFRGVADAGEQVESYIDKKTGIQVLSLYGSHKTPDHEDMKGIDYVVFDIQDVGVRFYTYTSTMHYLMEACAENNIGMIVLDRPNPNGFYIDGPVLDTAFRSFVGMDPVALVHGLTIGEYAMMINGEGWLKNRQVCKLTVVPCLNYTHDSLYKLPVKPSPNLASMNAIYLYPSLGLFEGTEMSIGRGTEFPYEVLGSPSGNESLFSFTPVPINGMSRNPKFENTRCYGLDLRTAGINIIRNKEINIQWLIDSYMQSSEKEIFFNPYFEKLAGTPVLREQVKSGLTVSQIRKSWKKELKHFKKMRKKYLLYE